MEQRIKKVEAMSISDVRQLKCGNAERFDKVKIPKEPFPPARIPYQKNSIESLRILNLPLRNP
ncbi:hypothetical protein RhiirB3_448115 [Rhizophagus irregularis]|nr:hypothetical protein RhiirB3_448115 [Rhizophagus irregularis]